MGPYPQMQMQMTQAQINAQLAVQFAVPALNGLVQARVITTDEYNGLMRSLNDPSAIQRMQSAIMSTYGNMNITQDTIERFLQDFYMSAVRNCRASQPVMPAQVYQAGYAYQQQNPNMMQMQMMRPGMGGGERAAKEMLELYGDKTLPTGLPERTEGARVKTAIPTTPPKRMPSNSLYDIDMTERDKTVSPPVWTVVPNTEYEDSQVEGAQSVNTVFDVSMARGKLISTEIRLETPFRSLEGAIADFVNNNDKYLSGEFAHLLSFDQIYLIRGYSKPEDKFNKLLEAYGDGSIKGIYNLITELGRQGEFGQDITNIMLKLFNRAAGSNFVRVAPDNKQRYLRMGSTDDLQSLSKLMMDDGSPNHEVWKENVTAFKDALGRCLKASVNRIFRTDAKCYLPMSDQKSMVFVLSDETAGIRIGGQSSRLAPYGTMTDTKLNDIKQVLSSMLVLVVERKVLLHNMKLPEIIPNGMTKLCLSAESLIIKEIFTKHGTFDMVSVNDPSQITRPYTLGQSYEGSLIVRRAD